MRVQVFGAVCLILLVGLAGCSAIPGIGSDQTPTPTPTPSNASQIDYPYGWNQTGLVNYARQKQNPLYTVDSLTFEFEREIRLADTKNGDYKVESRTSQVHKVSSIQKSWYIRVKRASSRSQYYLSGGVEFSRTVVLDDSGDVQSETVEQTRREFNKLKAYQIQGPELLIITTGWDTVDVVSKDGEKMIKYTATGVDSVDEDSPIYNIGQGSEITDYHAVLYVGKETGYIRELNITVHGKRGSDFFKATLHFEFYNIDDTNVTAPDWVAEAKNRTSPSPTPG